MLEGHRWTIMDRDFLHISPKAIAKILRNDYDVIVIINDGGFLSNLVFELEKRDTTIVYDLGDTLETSRTVGESPIPHPGYLFSDKLIENSDFVMAPSKTLHNSLLKRNENTVYNPTPINTNVFTPPNQDHSEEENNLPVIGWMGDARVHFRNLKIIKGPLLRLAQEHDFKFKIVNYLGDDRIKSLFSELEDYVLVDYGADSWRPIEEVVKEMWEFDIAALPLDGNDPFMNGKSPMKVTETMATKVPVVASGYKAYEDVVHHGRNGYLARTEDEWEHYIKKLLYSREDRMNIASNGYQYAIENHSVERYVDRFVEKILK